MSSLDVFDVLNIKQKAKSPQENAASSSFGIKTPKPQVTGIQRELYNLLGENQPPVIVSSGNKFKNKLKSEAKASPWSNTEFQVKDSIKLRHWTKGAKELVEAEKTESPFAKFDVHLRIPSFSEEEYHAFMKPKEGREDNEEKFEEWDFQEVAYLFDKCRKYDLRWFIIHDRYTYNGGRSLEDLKEQFYRVCQNFFEFNDPTDPLLPSLNFSKSQEEERKKYLKRLLARTAAEIAEEEALIIESRKFEMAARKTLNERETLLRLLDSPHSNQSVNQYMNSQGLTQLYNTLLSDKSRKRKHDTAIPENPWMKQQQQFLHQRMQLQQLQERKAEVAASSGTVSAVGTPSATPAGLGSPDSMGSPRKTKKQKNELQAALKKKSDSAYAEQLVNRFTAEEKKYLGIITHGEKLSPGVYLRSTKIPTYKPALQNKVNSVLQELGIPMRPAMPSYEVTKEYDEMLKSVLVLVNLKKYIDKMEANKAIIETNKL